MKLDEPAGRSIKIGSTTIRPLREKCVTEGCEREATSWLPLLPGGPAFCDDHYDRSTEYGADLTRFDPADPWDT